MKIRRPFRVYIYHGLFILLTSYRAFSSISTVGRYSLILLACIATISLISILVYGNYIELIDSQIVIHRDFFRTQSLPVQDFEQIKIEPGPFTSSYILLRNQTTVKINDAYINNDDLKEVMKQLNPEMGEQQDA